VQRLKRQHLQKQQVEGALDEVARFAHLGFLGESTAKPAKGSRLSLGKQGE
jgi:hypothetical protein